MYGERVREEGVERDTEQTQEIEGRQTDRRTLRRETRQVDSKG